jgi:protein ImuB
MFLVLHLPAFPLQALLRLKCDPVPSPAAVTEAQGKQSRVVAANELAQAGGVELGQSLAQARARLHALEVYSRQPRIEEAAMDLLFALAYTHTPYLERTGPGLLTLELRGLRGDGCPRLARAFLAELHTHGFSPRLGLGPTPDLALFTARATTAVEPIRLTTAPAATPSSPASFHRLPLTACRPSAALLTILHQWGLQTLGDLIALPRAEIARRLGEEAQRLWEQASGHRQRLLKRAEPPRVFSVYHEIEYTVHTLEPLLFILQRLLEQLTAQLLAAGRCAGALQLQLHLDHAAPYAHTFQLPAPSVRAELLFRVLHLHLEQVRTAEAITGLTLAATPVDPPHRQQGLFHAQLKDPWQLLETQTQLVGLVGHDRVGCPQMLDTHRPDAFEMKALPSEVPPLDTATRAALDRCPHERPLRRLRPPEPAQVWLLSGQPARLEHARWRGPVQTARGPFNTSGDWWQADTFWTRQEWDVTLSQGSELRLLHTPEGWAVEGIYD